MRCNYCGIRVKKKEQVCTGCSAPLFKMNGAARWALLLSVVALVSSVLPVLNIPFILLGFGMVVWGYLGVWVKKQDSLAKVSIALALLILAVVSTIGMIWVYQTYYDLILQHINRFLGGSSVKYVGQALLDVVTLKTINQ